MAGSATPRVAGAGLMAILPVSTFTGNQVKDQQLRLSVWKRLAEAEHEIGMAVAHLEGNDLDPGRLPQLLSLVELEVLKAQNALCEVYLHYSGTSTA